MMSGRRRRHALSASSPPPPFPSTMEALPAPSWPRPVSAVAAIPLPLASSPASGNGGLDSAAIAVDAGAEVEW